MRARRQAERREDEREQAEATAADTVSADQIEMKRVRWLWQEEDGQYQPQIPLAEVTIGAGREGAAKSQWTDHLTAKVTRGTLPGELYGQPRNVIICAREDSWEHTIKPRLVAAGADTSRVFRVEVRNVASGRATSLQLPSDNGLLESEITRLDAALVIFDPLLSALDARLNAYRAADVRRALEPLADIAHRTGASMVGLAHFAKMEGRDAASLISGSHAFKDVARAIIVFARDTETTGVMSQPKNNLGCLPTWSLEYSVGVRQMEVSDGVAWVPYFMPGQLTRRSVEDLLDTGNTRAIARAKDFLNEVLNDGPKPSKEVSEEAHERGIATRTLVRAKLELGVTPERKGGRWWISLNRTGTHGTDGSHGNVGTVGTVPSSDPSSPSGPTLPRVPNHSPARARRAREDFRRSLTGRSSTSLAAGYRHHRHHHLAIRERVAPLPRVQTTSATPGYVYPLERPAITGRGWRSPPRGATIGM